MPIQPCRAGAPGSAGVPPASPLACLPQEQPCQHRAGTDDGECSLVQTEASFRVGLCLTRPAFSP